jgi:hypothetical protein
VARFGRQDYFLDYFNSLFSRKSRETREQDCSAAAMEARDELGPDALLKGARNSSQLAIFFCFVLLLSRGQSVGTLRLGRP